MEGVKIEDIHQNRQRGGVLIPEYVAEKNKAVFNFPQDLFSVHWPMVKYSYVWAKAFSF